MTKKYESLYKIPKNILSTEYLHNKNIVKAAANIIKLLVDNDEVVCSAQMQSGKTDVMKRLIYVINKYNDEIPK